MSKATMDTPLAAAAALLVAETVLVLSGHGGLPVSGVVLFLMFYAVSMSLKRRKTLSGLSFTFRIFAMVSLVLYYPAAFTNWGFDTKVLIVPSVQLIMFGMGTKLSLGDFAREFRKPFKIIVGTALIYIIMPLVGLLIISVYGFQPEVAAGIILIGVCPAGAASNVMTYLANGNIALALSITILATLISPFSTPFLMKTYAGQLIAIDTVGMMISILSMILVPAAAGLICNKILYGKVAWLQRGISMIVVSLASFAAGVAVALAPMPAGLGSMRSGLVSGSLDGQRRGGDRTRSEGHPGPRELNGDGTAEALAGFHHAVHRDRGGPEQADLARGRAGAVRSGNCPQQCRLRSWIHVCEGTVPV